MYKEYVIKDFNITSILDLALNTPIKYEDNNIYAYPKENVDNVFEVNVISFKTFPKYLKINMFAKNINRDLEVMIFHPRKYHYDTFTVKRDFFIKGKLKFKYNKYQVINPSLIEEVNQIIPIYKPKSHIHLVKEYINEENLKRCTLADEHIKNLLAVHFCDPKIVELFNSTKTFSSDIMATLKYVEIKSYLLKLSFKKKDFKSLESLSGDESKFVSSLPFSLTKDQKKAISDIKADLSKDIAAKRMIVGDVGCGKTMVILSAVMMSYPQKSILMAPTSVLANQLFAEAMKYLPDFINITLVTNKSKEEDLSKYDFIVGTHALLFRDIPKAPLVMIDEQHRFGTNQRKEIKNLVSKGSARPHFLQFSATPIPRTLALMNSDLVDFSFIKQMPFKKDIDTKLISKSDFKDLLTHIKKEISKNNQTIIIYPLVENSEVIDYQSIEQSKDYWLNNFDKVYVTHGKDKQKNEVLEEFRQNGNILVATTLVEVGVSLPSLSTIVIVGAERLGLATLHQLRGRVSRNGLKGYCFLYCNDINNKRLEKFSKTMDGFEIAKLDLSSRQSGDILSGRVQSGSAFRYVDLSEDEHIIKKVKKDIIS